MGGYAVIILFIIIAAGVGHMVADWHRMNLQISCIEHKGKWDKRLEQCDFEGCK